MANAIITRNYENHEISYNADGWFNATEAAKKFAKRPNDWLVLPSTKSYIAALEKALGFDAGKSGIKLCKTSKVRGQAGTWLHPKMAVAFARWLDDDFAVWCDMQIDDIMRNGKEWLKFRHDTRQSNIVENAIIQATRADLGKETTAVHYMSEAKMVAFVAFGEFAGRDRDTMTNQELALVAHLETRNGVMYARGLPYDERKAKLIEIAEAWRAKHALKIAA